MNTGASPYTRNQEIVVRLLAKQVSLSLGDKKDAGDVLVSFCRRVLVWGQSGDRLLDTVQQLQTHAELNYTPTCMISNDGIRRFNLSKSVSSSSTNSDLDSSSSVAAAAVPSNAVDAKETCNESDALPTLEQELALQIDSSDDNSLFDDDRTSEHNNVRCEEETSSKKDSLLSPRGIIVVRKVTASKNALDRGQDAVTTTTTTTTTSSSSSRSSILKDTDVSVQEEDNRRTARMTLNFEYMDGDGSLTSDTKECARTSVFLVCFSASSQKSCQSAQECISFLTHWRYRTLGGREHGTDDTDPSVYVRQTDSLALAMLVNTDEVDSNHPVYSELCTYAKKYRFQPIHVPSTSPSRVDALCMDIMRRCLLFSLDIDVQKRVIISQQQAALKCLDTNHSFDEKLATTTRCTPNSLSCSALTPSSLVEFLSNACSSLWTNNKKSEHTSSTNNDDGVNGALGSLLLSASDFNGGNECVVDD